MARKTIADFERELNTLRELRDSDRRSLEAVCRESDKYHARMKELESENKWFKQMVQLLVEAIKVRS